ncbi:alpha/beta hydrolase [Cellulomonas shaoxiangyii]|uniref:Alpha/beta hydrolase n=1 Tax=Cellulomonas shaoxiangyii TaxID=2566013 RepID=A0A4P7SQW3_9CELL|nr:alpha/beta hydrolase [Cellulomonas shaoxiangyii]QCB95454.1 alpha/beta hydrolase [Cellulomonas shaoxiangyii]TGY77918.1 alpha/beta hydrolase [Cellulomonas shaoxiangyii]
MRADRWAPDVLGDGFEARLLPLADDDEGPVVATLVRYVPDATLRPARAVLYVHGWSDYFFQAPLAQYWHGLGAAFYALDLRKYGRSLRPYQTPGYVEDLRTYDEEIAAALRRVRAELGPVARVVLMGHSTGGLVLSLWAARHPGTVSGLVLNSPWLELQGSAIVRHVSAPAIHQLARFQPRAPLPNIDPGYYARTIAETTGGEWPIDDRWRPTPSFPVRAGWLRAVLDGHATVARGLALTVPVLTALSARTLISPRWSEEMRSADIVLDTEAIARRTIHLGPVSTLVRIPGGMHDLTLSARPARERFYAETTRWLAAYGWG